MPLGQRGHVAMVGRILCTKCTLHSDHRLTRVIFHHTKRLLPCSCHFLTTYSHCLTEEMWTTMKNNLLRKVLNCSFYLYRFRKYVSYGFPRINFCIPGVHYETPCIIEESRKSPASVGLKISPCQKVYVRSKIMFWYHVQLRPWHEICWQSWERDNNSFVRLSCSTFIVSDSSPLASCKTFSRHRVFLCIKLHMINDVKSHFNAQYS